MMIRTIAGAAAAVVLLSDCSPRPKQAATDREVLQSPAAAAVLKHVLGECPRRKEVRGLTITIGEKMEQAESEFEKQFNAPDLPVFHYRRLVVGAAAGKVRIFDESTGIAPLILQISSLTAAVDGRREAAERRLEGSFEGLRAAVGAMRGALETLREAAAAAQDTAAQATLGKI
jgi:hypothetical protein